VQTLDVGPVERDAAVTVCAPDSPTAWQQTLHSMGIETIQVCTNTGMKAKAFKQRVEVRGPRTYQLSKVKFTGLTQNLGQL
jgi:hypothetical protein